MSTVKFNSRAFSRLGQSGAIFGLSALAIREHLPLVCLTADMGRVAGLDRFKKSYPDDFYNVGIAEQNLIGLSAGLASEGYKAVAVAQACFITMRSFEQIRQYCGYMDFPVVIVGINAGFSLTFFGNTHYAIEDFNLMRGVPNMTVLSPSDAGAATKAFEWAVNQTRQVYIRLTGGLNTPIVYKDDYEYNPFVMNLVADNGGDVVVYATGSMVHQCIKATELLCKQGINARVYDVSCLKPLDVKTITQNFDAKLAVTVEEHSIIGGLGSAVSEVFADMSDRPRLIRIGVNDIFSQVGDYQYLLESHGLTADKITERINMEFNGNS